MCATSSSWFRCGAVVLCSVALAPVLGQEHDFIASFAPTVTNTSRGPVAVPIEIHQEAKIILVRARFGKNLEGRFMVDTGAAMTMVTPAFAKKLCAEFPRVNNWSAAAAGKVAAPRSVQVPLLTLGAMRFEEFTVTTASLEHLSKPLKTQLDGILGGNVLFARRCAFSVISRRLVLDAAVPPGVKPVACAAGGWAIGVPVTLDGQTKYFLLDSGASRSVLPDREWHGAVVETGRAMRGDMQETLTGLKTCTAVIKDLRVGEAPVPWLKLTLIESPKRLLGVDFISHYLLTIDAEQGQLWLQPPSPYVQ
jgi:predicted aspartyl protease